MKVVSIFTKNGREEFSIKDEQVNKATEIIKNPLSDLAEKLREMNCLSNKLTKKQFDEIKNSVEKIEFVDVDGKTVTLLKKMSKAEEHTPEEQAEFDKEKKEHPEFTDEQIWQIVADHLAKGGPGSGCQGPNCGRPSSGRNSEDDFGASTRGHEGDQRPVNERATNAAQGRIPEDKGSYVTIDGKSKYFPDETSAKDYIQQENAKQQRENNYKEIKQTPAGNELASFSESGHTQATQRAIDDSKKPGYKGPAVIDATGMGGKVPAKPTGVGDGSDASSAQSEVTNAPRQHSPESEAKFKDEIANRQVGRTITDQLGGNKFRVMTGAKDFVLHDKAVSFRVPKAKDGINHVKVSLNASDTYDVTFTRIRGDKATEVHALKDIYADQLQSVFKDKTGLDTHL